MCVQDVPLGFVFEVTYLCVYKLVINVQILMFKNVQRFNAPQVNSANIAFMFHQDWSYHP